MNTQEHGADSEELAIAEALRRSVMEKTREEAILGDVIRASVLSHDEELARAMQAEFDFEQNQQQLQEGNTVKPVNNEGHWLAVVRAGHNTQIASTNNAATLQHSSPRGVQSNVSTTARPAANRSVVTNTSSNVPPPLSRPNGNSSSVTRTNSASQISNVGSPVTPIRKLATPTVVLDGMNVGCALGGNGTRFRSRGIEIALEYYRARGVYAIALVPENKVNEKYGTNGLADDPKLLIRLFESNRVAFAPMGSHDDNYLLTYSMNINADLVSNDRYRKELSRQRGTEAAKRLRRFLKVHLVPFTFILEQFVPNPHPESLAIHLHHPRDKGYR